MMADFQPPGADLVRLSDDSGEHPVITRSSVHMRSRPRPRCTWMLPLMPIGRTGVVRCR
jgi:hypothetical protein